MQLPDIRRVIAKGGGGRVARRATRSVEQAWTLTDALGPGAANLGSAEERDQKTEAARRCPKHAYAFRRRVQRSPTSASTLALDTRPTLLSTICPPSNTISVGTL